jgi:hypothetical protein
MSLLQRRSGPRMTSLSAASLLCVLLASVIAPEGLPHGLLKKNPSVVLQASTTSITSPCQPDAISNSGSCPHTPDLQVTLTSVAKDFNKQPSYAYSVTGGRVVGEGSKVTWDLGGVWPGTYSATVEVQDHKKHRAVSSATVKIMNCPDCVPSCALCPTIVVDCPEEVKPGTPAICAVAVSGSVDLASVKWTLHDSNGIDLSERISGRGASISIRTDGLGGQNLTATVEVNGLDPACGRTASSSMAVKQ